MTISMKKAILFFTSILTISSAYAQVEGVEYNWKEKLDKEDIKIYTSKVPGSKYNAVRGVMTVKANVTSLVALVQDTSSCTEWAEFCKESRIHKKISDTEYYIYTYNDIPFPVTDRDAVTKVVWKQDPDTLRVSMQSTPTKGLIEKTKAVRIEEANSQWHFTPLKDGNTLVESFAHINPNGPTPAWLTNMLLVKAPFKTMKNMREITERGDYQNKSLAFINDPEKQLGNCSPASTIC